MCRIHELQHDALEMTKSIYGFMSFSILLDSQPNLHVSILGIHILNYTFLLYDIFLGIQVLFICYDTLPIGRLPKRNIKNMHACPSKISSLSRNDKLLFIQKYILRDKKSNTFISDEHIYMIIKRKKNKKKETEKKKQLIKKKKAERSLIS